MSALAPASATQTIPSPASVVAPAVTGATAASEAELREAAGLLLGPEAAASSTFTKCSGGVNNRVYYLDLEGGPSYVLRVYNNGFNTARVVYEHAVLSALAESQAQTPPNLRLPFALPTLITPLGAAPGVSMVALASGANACLFERVRGGPAPLAAARAIGRATAQLVAAMAPLPAPVPPCPNPLYRNLFASHHKTTRENFAEGMANAAFDSAPGLRAEADFLCAAVASAQAAIDRALAANLPEQQIHADCHFDNVLVSSDGAAVAAVLDFEFSSRDWRVMDLAVGLSKYVGQPGVEPAFEDWVRGYAEGGGRLTADEAALVPDLIVVRVLSNVVYFVGRALFGEDDWPCITSRAAMYAARIRWIRERAAWMEAVLRAHLVVAAN